MGQQHHAVDLLSPGSPSSPANAGLHLVSPTTLRLEVERLNTVLRSKNGELADLQKASNTSVVSAATLHEMQELWRTVHFQQEDMERASADLKVEYSRLKDEYRACCEDRDRLRAKLGQVEKENDGLTDISETQLATMRAEVRAITAKLVDQSDAAATSKMSEEAALAKVDILTKDLRAARMEIEDSHASLKELTDAHLELQGRLNDEHLARKRRCDALEAENASLQDRHNELIRQRDEFRKQSDADVRAKLAAIESQQAAEISAGEARRDKAHVAEELHRTNALKEQREAEIVSLLNKITFLEREVESERVSRKDSAADKVTLARLENDYNELRQFVESERSAKQGALDRAAAAEEKLARLEKENAELQKNTKAMQEDVRTITLQKARDAASVEVATNDLVGKVEELNEIVSSLRAECTKLNELLVVEQRASTDLQKRLNASQSEVARLEREVEDLGGVLTVVEAPLAAEQEARKAAEETNVRVLDSLSTSEKSKAQLASELHNTRLELERAVAKAALLQEECDEYYGNATSMENILDDLVALLRHGVPIAPTSLGSSRMLGAPLLSPSPHTNDSTDKETRETALSEARRQEYCELPAAIARLQDEVTQLQQAHQASASRERQVVATQQILEDALTSARAESARLEQHIESSQAERLLQQQEAAHFEESLRGSIVAKDHHIHDLEAKVRSTMFLEERVESLRRQLEAETKRAEIAEEAVEEERSHVAAEVSGLEARMRHAESDRDALLERVRSLEDEVDALASEAARVAVTHDRAVSPMMAARSERAVSPMIRSPSPRSRMERESLIQSSEHARTELAEMRQVAQARIADLHGLLAAEKEDKRRLLDQLDDTEGRLQAEQAAHSELKSRVDEMGRNHHPGTRAAALYSAADSYVPPMTPSVHSSVGASPIYHVQSPYSPPPPGNRVPVDARGQNEELLRQIEEQRRLLTQQQQTHNPMASGFQYGMTTPVSGTGSRSGSRNPTASAPVGRSAAFGIDANTMHSVGDASSVKSRSRRW